MLVSSDGLPIFAGAAAFAGLSCARAGDTARIQRQADSKNATFRMRSSPVSPGSVSRRITGRHDERLVVVIRWCEAVVAGAPTGPGAARLGTAASMAALEGTGTGSAGETPPPLSLERGTRCGRYVLLDRLGAGGMGVVYQAYDPSLDRKVALKLLRVREGAARAPHAHKRLVREARALARLSHPNVVHVYDVGVVGEDQVYLAMEYIE